MREILLIALSFILTLNLFASTVPSDSSYKYIIATRELKSEKFEKGKGVKVWDKKKIRKGIIESISMDSIYLSSFNKRNTTINAIAIHDIEALQPLNISKTKLHNIALIASGGAGIVSLIALVLLGNTTAAAGISFILIPAVLGALAFYLFIGFGISYIVKTIKERVKKCEQRKEFKFKAGS